MAKVVGIWASSATFKPDLTARLVSKVASPVAQGAPANSQSSTREQSKGKFSSLFLSLCCRPVLSTWRPSDISTRSMAFTAAPIALCGMALVLRPMIDALIHSSLYSHGIAADMEESPVASHWRKQGRSSINPTCNIMTASFPQIRRARQKERVCAVYRRYTSIRRPPTTTFSSLHRQGGSRRHTAAEKRF